MRGSCTLRNGNEIVNPCIARMLTTCFTTVIFENFQNCTQLIPDGPPKIRLLVQIWLKT